MNADNNSGLEVSTMILKARNVIIDNNGPKITTIKVVKLENKNLSKILLMESLFLTIFSIFSTFCCKFTSIFYHV